jgi:hypothetical protein
MSVYRAEYDEGIDLWVPLFNCGKDNRRRYPAESPARVRNNACDYYFGKRHIQRRFFETLLYLVNALVILAGVKLAGHYGASLFHIAYPSVAFLAPSRYDYTIIRDVNIL